MEKLIIIKYGELGTKKGNIGYFLSLLKKNVIWQLKGIDSHVTFDIGRMFVETSNFDECIKRLQNVFGIHEMTIAYKIGNDIYRFELTDKGAIEYEINGKRVTLEDEMKKQSGLPKSASLNVEMTNSLKRYNNDSG